ncbi:hypothetical protein Slala03_50070 [Streptomyces lavendulae subsp. lavendulae]|nr:hypothetical protein Slala03_50070 [Streptomyces lavendulae subsp. lavendulae]
MRHRLVPGGVQIRDDLRPDQPGTADDRELHDMPSVGKSVWDVTDGSYVAFDMRAGWHIRPTCCLTSFPRERSGDRLISQAPGPLGLSVAAEAESSV